MEKEVIVATRIDFTWPQLIEIIGSKGERDHPANYTAYTGWRRSWLCEQTLDTQCQSVQSDGLRTGCL